MHGGHIDQIATSGNLILLGGECARASSADVHKFRIISSNGSYTLRGEAGIQFPRSCVKRLLSRANRVSSLSFLADGFLVSVSEFSDDIQYEIHHEMNNDLTPRRCWASDAFQTLHRRLQLDGSLRHLLTPVEITSLCRAVTPAPAP